MSEFLITAEKRSDAGKGASRRLRRLQHRIPAIIYGGSKDPENISLESREIKKLLEDEAAYSSVVTIDIEGSKQSALIRDMQRHPSRNWVTHIDFQRIDEHTLIRVNVPLHFINEEACHGVKMEGGTLSHSLSEVEVMALPKDIPEYIEVDTEALELGQKLHLSDIKLPEGVTIIALTKGDDYDLPIVAVQSTRASKQDEELDAEEAAAAEEASEEATEEAEGGEE